MPPAHFPRLVGAAVLGCSTVGFAQDGPPAATPPTTPPPAVQPDSGATADMATPADLPADFVPYVDYGLMDDALATLDAAAMTDVGLQIRFAEGQLNKPHEPLPARQALEVAGRLAAAAGDEETLDRLARVAEADGDADAADAWRRLAELSADSRDGRGEPMFSAFDVMRGAVQAFGNLVLQIRAAQLGGDADTLERLRTGIDGLEPLSDPLKQELRMRIDRAADALGKADGSLDSLRQLVGASRGWPPSRHGLDHPTPGGSGGDYAGVIIDDGAGAGGGATPGYSNLISGLRYTPTGSGAVVHQHGRLGTILFEPGDIIMSIGGVQMGPNSNPDAGVNAGYLSGNRTVVVRDRNTGRVVTLRY